VHFDSVRFAVSSRCKTNFHACRLGGRARAHTRARTTRTGRQLSGQTISTVFRMLPRRRLLSYDLALKRRIIKDPMSTASAAWAVGEATHLLRRRLPLSLLLLLLPSSPLPPLSDQRALRRSFVRSLIATANWSRGALSSPRNRPVERRAGHVAALSCPLPSSRRRRFRHRSRTAAAVGHPCREPAICTA
jgi:hypothetical protein